MGIFFNVTRKTKSVKLYKFMKHKIPPKQYPLKGKTHIDLLKPFDIQVMLLVSIS
jgi:hypothetical protein